MKRLARILILASTLTWVVAASVPASAAPSNTAVKEVVQLPCSGSGCEALSSGSAVAGSVEATVSSTSSIGLAWIRIEAALESGSESTWNWVCIYQWNAGNATSIEQSAPWDTRRWPSDSSIGACSGESAHGQRTKNGVYSLRAVAKENITDEIQRSSTFRVKVNNRPTAPSWAAEPVAISAAEGGPGIELRWNPSPEPDIVEYHYVRTGPDGAEYEYEVHAAEPGRSGCDKDGSTYVCVDEEFPSSGYGGEYTYSLVAYRASPVSGDKCYYGGNCIQSQMTGSEGAHLSEPSPSPSPSKTIDGDTDTDNRTNTRRSSSGGTRTSSSPSPRSSVLSNRSSDDAEFYTGEYEETLPYDDARGFLPGTSSPSPDDDETQDLATNDQTPLGLPFDSGRRLWTFLASGMVMVLSAAHMARFLRDR